MQAYNDGTGDVIGMPRAIAKHSYRIEVTDTFGGDANYSWCNRTKIDGATIANDRAKSRRQLVRRAKAFAGWTGLRCTVSDYGDTIEIRPAGICQVCFVMYSDFPA